MGGLKLKDLKLRNKFQALFMRVFKVENFTGELRAGNDETTPQWKTLDEMRALDQEGKLLPNAIKAVEVGMKL